MKNTILFFVVILCMHSIVIAQIDPPPSIPALSGVPNDIDVHYSWRESAGTSYVLPGDISLFDLDPMDIMFMEPYETDERIFIGANSVDTNIFIRHILNPGRQFSPQTMPYQLLLMYDGTSSYFGLDGSVAFSQAYDPEIPEINGTPPSPDTIIRSLHVYIMQDYQLEVDTLYMATFETEFEDSLWIVQQVTLYDPADSLRGVPVYSLKVSREVAPSGQCIFKVEDVVNSEYYNSSQYYSKPLHQDHAVIAAARELSFLPNPAGNSFTINMPESWKQSDHIEIQVFSLSGVLIHQEQTQYSPMIWQSCRDWTPGIYVVRIESPLGILAGKLIKK